MLILSLDSTALIASVALSDDDRFLAGTVLNIGNKHSTTLLPAAKFVLETSGYNVQDIEMFALAAGPGSFTGVRIGVGTVKGLAFGRNVPCIGVSSLEMMAEAFSHVDGLVCPMINARRDRYFTAYFSAECGKIIRLTEDDIIEGEMIEEYMMASERQIFLTGDGAEVFLKDHNSVSPVQIPEMMKYPFAYYAGIIAKRIYSDADERKRSAFMAGNLRPVYLRQPQAERELAERIKAN